ncbi:hypothetical protein ABMA27_001906 [Loxostege sticticalis]|uniref:FP protein C-terminal domain-containing protein n=1 Tax=Loxostege sticticalis TaxID=481309 RepID=A0ABR3HVW0_LOXSC
MSRGTKSQVSKSKAEQSPNTELSSLFTELRQLRHELSEVKHQNREIKTQMTSLSETLKQTLNEHSKQLQHVDLEIANLKSTVGILQQQLAARDQDSLRNHLEISGITEESNENLSHVVLVASRKIGIELAESDIEDVQRVGSRSGKSKTDTQNKIPRPIVVKLLRKCKRDDILRAAKSRRSVTSEDIVAGQPSKIFFNERLTKENRNLFRDARLRTKEYGFRYCWVRSGNIYVRKGDGKPAIRITSNDDLDEKVGAAKAAEESSIGLV